MTAANTLTERAAAAINDAGLRRWSAAEWLDYLNDGRRALIVQVPQALPINEVVQLVAGTRQTLPANRVSLISVVRNMGTNGATPGRYVRTVRREDMDAISPAWHTDTATDAVDDAAIDPRDPLIYYVWPPNTGDGRAEINCYSAGEDITHDADTGMLAIYDPYLVHYMLFRAYGKNTDTQSLERSLKYYELFQTVNGMKGK